MEEEQIEEVVEICQAYENGFAAARLNFSNDYNQHKRDSPSYYAWVLGHNNGIQLTLIEHTEGWIN